MRCAALGPTPGRQRPHQPAASHHQPARVRQRQHPGHVRGRDRTGGRGTHIMQALSTHFERASDEDGTIVRLVIPCLERTPVRA